MLTRFAHRLLSISCKLKLPIKLLSARKSNQKDRLEVVKLHTLLRESNSSFTANRRDRSGSERRLYSMRFRLEEVAPESIDLRYRTKISLQAS